MREILDTMLQDFCEKFTLHQDLDKLTNSQQAYIEISGQPEIDRAYEQILKELPTLYSIETILNKEIYFSLDLQLENSKLTRKKLDRVAKLIHKLMLEKIN